MIRKFLILLAPLLLLSLSARGAEIYLQIDNIAGESQARECEYCIEVQSFSLTVKDETSGHAGGAPSPGGRATFAPLVITKNLDATSPLLFRALATAEHLQSCKLRVFITIGGEKVEYYTIELMDAFVADISTHGTETDARFTEQVSFLYRKIKWTYVTLDETGHIRGKIEFAFDLETNSEA
jgi:type VI secretion system secreted protein Hcp